MSFIPLGFLGASGSVEPNFESIATVNVGSGGAGTVSFTSIPSTYKHLQIRAILRNAGDGLNSTITFNSDTASNYTYHYLLGDSSSASTSGTGSSSTATYLQVPGSAQTASVYGATVIDILDYSNTNKYKTVRNLQGYDLNGDGRIALWSSVWTNTSAISNITFSNGVNFAQYSSFALYGVK